MLDKDSLQMNIYDYLKYCNKKETIKAVGVISDKQYVFYSQVKKNDYLTHEEISLKIENIIYKKEFTYSTYTYNKNNVHLFSSGDNEIIIDLPTTGIFTKSQYSFLDEVLTQIEKYNNDNKIKVKIAIFTPNRQHFNKFDLTDIKEIKEELKELITREIVFQEESIIGNTLDKNKLITNIIYHTGIKQCKTTKDLINTLIICDKYYNDSYYSKIFKEIFPNYIEVKEKVLLLDPKEEISNINFNNIQSKIKLILLKKEINKINTQIEQNNIIILGLEKIIRIINIKKNIINNKDKLTELYNEDNKTKELIDNENSKIEEIDRQINLTKYNKELSSKKIKMNTRNTFLELINISKNNRILKVINQYEKDINILEQKKNSLIEGKQKIIDKEKRVIEEFKNISGLNCIPTNFLNIKINICNSNEETIQKELLKFKKINENLEKELNNIKGKLIDSSPKAKTK